MDVKPEHMENELDLTQLIKIMWQRWYVIVAAVVLVVTLTGLYAYGYRDNEYTARVTFAIRVEDDVLNPATGHALAERLVNSYVEFSTSKIVLDELRTRLQNDNGLQYTNSQLAQMIAASGRVNTIVLDIRLTHGDPATAVVIARELIDVIDYFTEEATNGEDNDRKQIQNLQSIDIWGQPDEGSLAPLSGPNRVLFMAIGLLLGIMVGVLGVFLIEFFDKTIKTSRDIENKLNMRVLGIIPDYKLEKKEVSE